MATIDVGVRDRTCPTRVSDEGLGYDPLTMTSSAYTDAYVEALRRELTRAQARLTRAERERDQAIAENERLRTQIATEREAASRVKGEKPQDP
jgi:hypothetical protein